MMRQCSAHLEDKALLGDPGGVVVHSLVLLVGEAVLRGVLGPVGVHDRLHQVVVVRGVGAGGRRVHHQRLLIVALGLHTAV